MHGARPFQPPDDHEEMFRRQAAASWPAVRRVVPMSAATARSSRLVRRTRTVVARVAVLGLIAASLAGVAMTRSAPKAQAAAACPSGGCSVTVDARDFPTGTPLASFTYMVNLDNTKLPGDPQALSTESNSPIVREGDQTRKTITLPAGRYLISVRSLGHKM